MFNLPSGTPLPSEGPNNDGASTPNPLFTRRLNSRDLSMLSPESPPASNNTDGMPQTFMPSKDELKAAGIKDFIEPDATDKRAEGNRRALTFVGTIVAMVAITVGALVSKLRDAINPLDKSNDHPATLVKPAEKKVGADRAPRESENWQQKAEMRHVDPFVLQQRLLQQYSVFPALAKQVTEGIERKGDFIATVGEVPIALASFFSSPRQLRRGAEAIYAPNFLTKKDTDILADSLKKEGFKPVIDNTTGTQYFLDPRSHAFVGWRLQENEEDLFLVTIPRGLGRDNLSLTMERQGSEGKDLVEKLGLPKLFGQERKRLEEVYPAWGDLIKEGIQEMKGRDVNQHARWKHRFPIAFRRAAIPFF